MASYQPPHTLTPAILNRLAEIAQALGRMEASADQARALRLRRINRVRTIQGSLAIEGNTLSEEQITAILDGKRVIAPPREVQEVRNALEAYEYFDRWNPISREDLLHAHRLLMQGLIDEAGVYRRGGVGVMSGDRVVHTAPQASRVPQLMGDLMGWLETTEAHPLVASSVFHYEFEFIHPFADGNGRMGRLWQSLILAHWNPLFADVPVESLVFEYQENYYRAIRESTRTGDCAPFIEFMLGMILAALQSSADQVTDQVTDQVMRLLAALKAAPLGTKDLLGTLKLSHRPSFMQNYLQPALEAGLVEMTQPDSPRSPTQKYRLTDKGRQWLAQGQ